MWVFQVALFCPGPRRTSLDFQENIIIFLKTEIVMRNSLKDVCENGVWKIFERKSSKEISQTFAKFLWIIVLKWIKNFRFNPA
jgi:hypothetical protein